MIRRQAAFAGAFLAFALLMLGGTALAANVASMLSTGMQVGSGSIFGFSSSTDATASADVAISRVSAGRAALGTGAAANTGGTLDLSVANLTKTDGLYLTATSSDAGNANFNFANQATTNAGDGSRKDSVWYLGYNAAAGGGLSTAGEPSIQIQMEGYYNPDGNKYLEGHWAYVSSGSVVFRPITMQINRSTSNIALGVNFDTFTLTNSSGTQLEKLNSNGSTTLDTSFVYQHGGNNVSWLTQINAAGSSYIPIARVDASNRVQIAPGGAAIYLSGNVAMQTNVGFSVDGNATATSQQLTWSNDVGIKRSATGTLAITDGGAGSGTLALGTGTLKWAAGSTGSTVNVLGTAGPNATTTPNTWVAVKLSDGSTGYMPVWK